MKFSQLLIAITLFAPANALGVDTILGWAANEGLKAVEDEYDLSALTTVEDKVGPLGYKVGLEKVSGLHDGLKINDLETTGDNGLSLTVDATNIKLSADAEVSMFGKKLSWDAGAKVDAKVEVTGTYTYSTWNTCITLESLKAKVVSLEPHITVEYTGVLGALVSKWQSKIQTKIVQLLQGKIASAVADWIESLGGEGSSEITKDDFDGERQEFDGMKVLEYFGVDINELTGYKCAEAKKQESMKQARKFDTRLSVLEQRLHELERA